MISFCDIAVDGTVDTGFTLEGNCPGDDHIFVKERGYGLRIGRLVQVLVDFVFFAE